jgi:hypothetical protein
VLLLLLADSHSRQLLHVRQVGGVHTRHRKPARVFRQRLLLIRFPRRCHLLLLLLLPVLLLLAASIYSSGECRCFWDHLLLLLLFSLEERCRGCLQAVQGEEATGLC